MISANSNVNALHMVFCDTTGWDLRMTATAERFWCECHMEGLTPEDLRAVIIYRKRLIKAGDRKQSCISIHNICGTSEAILDTLCDASMLRAMARKRTLDPARASILRQTGRSDTVPVSEAKPVAEIIQKLKAL